MNRPSSRRALLALASGVACVGVLLSGTPASGAVPTTIRFTTPTTSPTTSPAGPSSPSTPTPSESPAPAGSPGPSGSATPSPGADQPAPTDPLVVDIERLTPSALPSQAKKVQVSGTITNRSKEEWTDLSVYLLTSAEPMTTPEQLAAAVGSDQRSEVATRIVDPGLFVRVPDLAPGEHARFDLAVPSDRLGISGAPGVYWLGVQVLGSNSLGRDASADGRDRTFLPLVPQRNDGTELALGLQLRNHTVRGSDGRLEYLDGWQAIFGENGRLGRLLELSQSAPTDQKLSLVVDPAVLDAAVSVAHDNPALELAPAEQGDGGSGDSGNDSGGSGGSGSTSDDPTPEQTAASWREDFFAEARRHSVLSLPYGDLDVSAVMRHAVSDLLASAFASSTTALAQGDVTGTPVLIPPSGLISPSAVTQLDPALPVVVAPQALVEKPSGPVLNRADGGRMLVAPVPDDMWGPGPDPRSALAVRQRLLADAALHALSGSRDQPLVRFLPPGWDPGRHWQRARFFRGLDVPWLTPVDVTDVLNELDTSPPVDPTQDLTYPDSELDAELPLATVLATESLIAAGSTVEELVTSDSQVDEQVIRLALLASSVWSRPRPGLAAERAVGARDRVSGWLDEVTVRGPSFVTMSSESGTFQVTVVNGLDEPVTVGLRATVPGGDLTLSTPEPLELAPNSRGPMRIDASSTDIGVHLVTLQPVSTEGTPLGRPTTVSIRSSRVGFILWIVMAIGGTALFVAIILRIWRRVRQRRRTPGPVLKQGSP